MAHERRARIWRGATWVVFSAFAALLIVALAPVAPLGSAWWDKLIMSNVELKSEIGWPELVQSVAQVYNALPESDRAHVGIMAASSGEIGSIALYGPDYGLPRPISGFDSFWQYGYGDPPPQTLIVVGFWPEILADFQDCTFVKPITMPFDIQNEETINQKKPSITGQFTCATICASLGPISGRVFSISAKPTSELAFAFAQYGKLSSVPTLYRTYPGIPKHTQRVKFIS
jgi:hypothetical protein